MKGKATMELKGWKVEINDCEWVIVHAMDVTEAKRLGWNEYTAMSGHDRDSLQLDGLSEEATVTPIPDLDGGEMTVVRLINLGLLDPRSVMPFTRTDFDQPVFAVYLTSEW